MKKLLLILLFIPIVGIGQSLEEAIASAYYPGYKEVPELRELSRAYLRYLDYCFEDTTIVREQQGVIETSKEIPIYNECDEVVAYRRVGDTIWQKYKCKNFLRDKSGEWSISGGTFTISGSSAGYLIFESSSEVYEVTRKVECTLNREKPSMEGFYEWLFKQISGK